MKVRRNIVFFFMVFIYWLYEWIIVEKRTTFPKEMIRFFDNVSNVVFSIRQTCAIEISIFPLCVNEIISI